MDICVSYRLEHLPDELIIRIFSWLSTADLVRIHSVPNKRMKNLTLDKALSRYFILPVFFFFVSFFNWQGFFDFLGEAK